MVELTEFQKLKNDKFIAFIECDLDLARNLGSGEGIEAKEKLAWKLHEQFPPTGSLLLGQLILQQKTSLLNPETATKEFAKELVTESFKGVHEMEQKDGWDFYFLGLSYIYGRGTPQDFSLAAKAFSDSLRRGNRYASFEAIWARYLAGGSRLEAILQFTELSGNLADFAARSARILAILEIGPSREPGSPAHITRIILLGRALRGSIYHAHGSRQINIAIEQEFRKEVDELRALKTARGYLGLYLIAGTSRANPTGRQPLEWFHDAIDPEMAELQVLCRCHYLGSKELRMIAERARSEGWVTSPLALLAENELEGEEP
jgi:hypothetical protein